MRKDAVVLEIQEKTAVVLASDGRFLRVRNQGYHVGQRIPEAEQTSIRPRSVLRRTLLIAACFVLVLGSSALAASKYMVWSYAGVDVGDLSVNYTLNFRNEVLNAEGNSAEAEQLIGSLEKIPYEPVDSAVERMLEAAEESQPEETETSEVVISVASFMGGTERTEERIKEGIHRSMEKGRPDEPGNKDEGEIRVERLEWQDAGKIMEERHQPQNTQLPADAGEGRRPPEETAPKMTENPTANPPEDAPQGMPEASSKTDEMPVQKPETNEEKQENLAPEKQEDPAPEQKVSGPDQQEQRGDPPEAENSTGRPVENDTSPLQEERIPEETNGQQMQPAFDNSPEQQPANRPPENEMNEPNAPGGMQNPPGAGEEFQPQPGQQQPRPDGGMGP